MGVSPVYWDAVSGFVSSATASVTAVLPQEWALCNVVSRFPHLKHLFDLLGGVQLFCLLFVCMGGLGVGGSRPVPGFAFLGCLPHTSTLCVCSPIFRPFFTISSAISQLNTSSLMFPVPVLVF